MEGTSVTPLSGTLVEELKTRGMELSHHDEIVDIIPANIH